MGFWMQCKADQVEICYSGVIHSHQVHYLKGGKINLDCDGDTAGVDVHMQRASLVAYVALLSLEKLQSRVLMELNSWGISPNHSIRISFKALQTTLVDIFDKKLETTCFYVTSCTHRSSARCATLFLDKSRYVALKLLCAAMLHSWKMISENVSCCH